MTTEPPESDQSNKFTEAAQAFLGLLKSLPPTPSITFRGYIDRTATESRVIGAPSLTATSHSISIATNNLKKPEVAIFIGSNGRDLTPILEGAPMFNLQEVTYLPGTYFIQHPPREFLGVTIQLHEELHLNEETGKYEATRKFKNWDPIIIEFEPALRQARTAPHDFPPEAPERFLIPIK